MTFLFLLTALAAAIYGALTGNGWALLAAALSMAVVIMLLARPSGREDIKDAQYLVDNLLGSPWRLVLVAALLCAAGATWAADARGDPDPLALALWVASIVLLLAAGVLHDRKTQLWRRLVVATRLDRYDWVALAGLTLLALALRVYLLGPNLPAIHGDEGEMGMLARLALYGPGGERGPLVMPYFRTGFLDHPTLFHYLQAGFLLLFGDTIFSLKLLSAFFGALCAPLIYLIGRVGWGRVAGFVGGWLLAVSHLHIHYSRIALNNIETVWFTILFILLVILVDALGKLPDARAAAPLSGTGEEDALPATDGVWATPMPVTPSTTPSAARLTLFVLIGLTVGLSQYFYYGSRLIPLLAVPLLLLLWITRRAALRDLAVAMLTTVAVYLPLLAFYTRSLPAFLNRTSGVSVFNQDGIRHVLGPAANWPGDLSQLLRYQLQRNAEFFISSGDLSAFYLPELPAFDPLTIACFWLGFGVLIVQWRRFPAQALLLWLLLGVFLGGVMTNDAPNAPRLIVAVPAVFVIAGVAVQKLFEVAGALWPSGQRWVALTAGVTFCALTLNLNYTTYFVQYAWRQPFLGWTEMAEMMESHATSHRTVLIGDPNLYVEHGTMRFLANDAERANLFAVDEFPAQLAAAVAAGKGVLLIALPHRLDDLAAIAATHPGGVRADHYDNLDRLTFVSYLLPAE